MIMGLLVGLVQRKVTNKMYTKAAVILLVSVLFNAGGGQSCLEQDHKYNIVADVNNFTASVSTSAVNNSKYCCLTNIEFTVTDVDTYTIDVLAAQIFPPHTLFRCICEDYSLIVHEPLPVQDIDSRTIYGTVTVYWSGAPDYTYNVSIPELDIFNRSTDIAEISFNLKDEGIQANTSYTVVVESIVCGTPGNASSAVITIAMEPQISNEVTYGGYSFINNSYVSWKLMTKVSFPDSPASYPNNVMLNLTCTNNDTQEVLLVLPVLVLEDGSVTVEFEIPRQRCDGYLSWQNKSPKQFDQLIAIEISDREEISNPAGGDSEISFSYFLTCCFISEKNLVEHEVCQLYNQTFSGSIVTIQAVHKCDGNYYVVCLDFDIHPNPTSPSTSIITSTFTSTCACSSSSLTTSSTTSTTSSTSSNTPEPTNRKPSHGEICLNTPAFISMIISLVLLGIIGIITAIGISIKFEKIKSRLYDCIKHMRLRSANLPENAVADPSDSNPVRVISANRSGVIQSITAPINVGRSSYDTMSHSEQSLNTNQTQSVVNDGRSDRNPSSQGSSQPLLPPPRQQHASASVI